MITCNFFWLFELSRVWQFFWHSWYLIIRHSQRIDNSTFSTCWQFNILDTTIQHSWHVDNSTFSTHGQFNAGCTFSPREPETTQEWECRWKHSPRLGCSFGRSCLASLALAYAGLPDIRIFVHSQIVRVRTNFPSNMDFLNKNSYFRNFLRI